MLHLFHITVLKIIYVYDNDKYRIYETYMRRDRPYPFPIENARACDEEIRKKGKRFLALVEDLLEDVFLHFINRWDSCDSCGSLRQTHEIVPFEQVELPLSVACH